jgi:uncharacterized cupredoxin-like copper-binding protein
MTGKASIGLLAALLAATGCTATDVVSGDSAGYLADAPQRVAAADWSRAQTVEVALSEFKYVPAAFRFRSGEPYRLRFVNRGVEPHDFTAEPFFKAIAVQKLATKDGDVAAPKLRSIGLNAGETKELFFVPIVPGRYSFDCDEPLHALFGMNGEAVIE